MAKCGLGDEDFEKVRAHFVDGTRYTSTGQKPWLMETGDQKWLSLTTQLI